MKVHVDGEVRPRVRQIEEVRVSGAAHDADEDQMEEHQVEGKDEVKPQIANPYREINQLQHCEHVGVIEYLHLQGTSCYETACVVSEHQERVFVLLEEGELAVLAEELLAFVNHERDQ